VFFLTTATSAALPQNCHLLAESIMGIENICAARCGGRLKMRRRRGRGRSWILC
jgi:hypothetical protein